MGPLQRRVGLVAIVVMIACGGAAPSPRDTEAGRAGATIVTPPGAPAYPEELRARLAEALARRGAGYEPRTHHLRPDGSPVYTNRLILETSPYLLQHAHNPVDWYPWGEEAFEAARRLDRPILLSIGYSTCHWCHVMERESFEDEEIARFLNEHFIAIKVDREERPDLDSVYMAAVNAMGVNGGWPMTTVLTPDLRPFFGGTYFPARAGDRGARKGFWEILHELERQYRTDRAGVVQRAAAISQAVARSMKGSPPGDVPGAAAIANAVRALAGSYDPVNGGFGNSRKFPRPVTLELLLRYHRRSGDPKALEMVVHTLERMAGGGIHDQIGGGFHRYTVESTWLIPHFEKMLYDNAQLAVVYLEAHQITGRDDFAEVARRTLDYVGREMTDESGGFWSATDAESPSSSAEYEEGLFFTWTPVEIRELLGEDLARKVIAHYGVSERGNFEGRNVLHVARPIASLAPVFGVTEEQLRRDIQGARRRMYEARLGRRAPHTDRKILTAWNGLMISAFAKGAMVFPEERHAGRAAAAARFILSNMKKGDRLFRSHADGRPGKPGVLSDYAFLAAGLLDLFETTSDERWLTEAIALHETLEKQFWDEEAGGFFMTANDAETLLAREKPHYDGAEPSGNSVAALNLLRLHEFTGKERYREMAERTFAGFSRYLARTSAPLMLCALDFYLDSPKEIVLVVPGDLEEAAPFMERLSRRFLPNRVLIATPRGGAQRRLASVAPLVKDRPVKDGRTTAYVCENRVCKLPTTDPDVFAKQIADVSPYEAVALEPLTLPAPPLPWEYDKARNRHWNPEHRHWHQGPPPSGTPGD